MSTTQNAKLVLLGTTAVGKSSIVLRFSRNEFSRYPESTIGAAFSSQSVPLNDRVNVTFDIWDTAGQEKYQSLAPMYYREACAAIVVYDITNRKSFRRAQTWINELRKPNSACYEHITIALVGNKTDLSHKRKIQLSQAEELAERMSAANPTQKVLCLECSAKTGVGVNEIFTSIARNLDLEKIKRYYQFGDGVLEGRGHGGDGRRGVESIRLRNAEYWRGRNKNRGCCTKSTDDDQPIPL